MLLVIPINIRLGWKGLQGKNTPHYENPRIAAVKSFIELAHILKELLLKIPLFNMFSIFAGKGKIYKIK
jgi:hypothetical protein